MLPWTRSQRSASLRPGASASPPAWRTGAIDGCQQCRDSARAVRVLCPISILFVYGIKVLNRRGMWASAGLGRGPDGSMIFGVASVGTRVGAWQSYEAEGG